jgi:hypothetical protein
MANKLLQTVLTHVHFTEINWNASLWNALEYVLEPSEEILKRFHSKASCKYCTYTCHSSAHYCTHNVGEMLRLGLGLGDSRCLGVEGVDWSKESNSD